jgi:FAD/FMN-containing dehydrogenase
MTDFAQFEDAFKGDLVIPSSPAYASSIARWSVTAIKQAVIVAFVSSPEDVALAIRYAKANKLAIAVKGGGHNPGGASSIEGGLVIDLSRHLNKVRVDAKEKKGYVGGGAIWETVDKEAIKEGLATVGGTVNHVRDPSTQFHCLF